MFQPEQKKGFTLMELMIVLGTIGILSGIVVTAVNPRDQIVVANNAKRIAAEREIKHAFQTYSIDEPHVAQARLAEIEDKMDLLDVDAVDICAKNNNDPVNPDTTCVYLQALEEYMTLPVDILEPKPTKYTGFQISVDTGGQVAVKAKYKEQRGGDSGGQAVLPPAPEPKIIWWGTSPSQGIYQAPLSNVANSQQVLSIGSVNDVSYDSNTVMWRYPTYIGWVPLSGGPANAGPSNVNDIFGLDRPDDALYFRATTYGSKDFYKFNTTTRISTLIAQIFPYVNFTVSHVAHDDANNQILIAGLNGDTGLWEVRGYSVSSPDPATFTMLFNASLAEIYAVAAGSDGRLLVATQQTNGNRTLYEVRPGITPQKPVNTPGDIFISGNPLIVDDEAGYFYWIGPSFIYSATSNGLVVEKLTPAFLSQASGLQLDHSQNRLLWTEKDVGISRIQYVPLDVQGPPQTLINNADAFDLFMSDE